MNQNTNQQTKKHNGIISFWKFCFCIMIIIFHTDIFMTDNITSIFSKGGYIAVEFFFLVSGFLMAKSALNKKDEENSEGLVKETFHFIMKKIKNFFPYVLFAEILGIIFQNIYLDMNVYQNVSTIWDLFLLRMTGLKGNFINIPTWYLSSMLLCMMIIYPLLRKYKNNFIYLIGPIIVLFGFGWLNKNYPSFKSYGTWLGWIYLGTIRAFLNLTLGSILYAICEKLKNINFTKLGKLLITIIEIFGFTLPFFIAHFIDKAYIYDFIVIFILSISIVLAFSEKTLEFKLFNNKFFFWLEKFSFPLFVCHFIIRIFVTKSSLFLSMTYYDKLLVYLSLTFIVSLICMFLIDYLKNKNFFLAKIKKLIIAK